MNAWLKPYRRALNIDEPIINISEKQQFEDTIDIVIEKGVPVVSFTFGIPEQSILSRLKERTLKL